MDKRRLKVSVYAIMKDEEQFFDRWIKSMWDSGNGADEICVLDTGSKEGWEELLYKSADKVGSVILSVLNVSQFLLPYTGQLTALEQFLLDEVDEFDACGSGYEVFSLALDISSFEESLDDTCSR